MEDQRKSVRQRTFKGGIISHDLAASIDCTVKNLSPLGALLEADSPVGIPDKFTLIIKPERSKWNCEVVWRKAKKIGVRFVA